MTFSVEFFVNSSSIVHILSPLRLWYNPKLVCLCKLNIFLSLGDGYTISQLGSSVSYPNSPIQDYVSPGHEFMESDLQDHHDGGGGDSERDHHNHHHHHHHHLLHNQHHHHPNHHRESPAGGHHLTANGGGHLLLGPSATLGRHSGRFGSRKSPFQVVIPSGASGHNKLTCPPPVCSTPQGGESAAGMLPILGALGSPNRQLPEFSTFGPGGGYLTKLRGDEEQRHGGLEPSGHLV